MSLISQWNGMAEAERSPEESKAFWDEYFEIMGNDVESGGHYPFDPIASKSCQQYGIRVYTLKFDKLDILKDLFFDKDVEDFTIIS